MVKKYLALFAKTCLALGVGCFGFLVAFFGLARIGMLWHFVNRGVNLDFLHLDWVLQPDLEYWGSHMMNLLTVVIGLMLMAGSARWLIRRLLAWRSSRSAELT